MLEEGEGDLSINLEEICLRFSDILVLNVHLYKMTSHLNFFSNLFGSTVLDWIVLFLWSINFLRMTKFFVNLIVAYNKI